MPVKYIPYIPNTVEGQAILDNITRTRRVLRYRDNGEVHDHIRRGLPLYETSETETVGANESGNLLLRGECLSACAYLKNEGIALDLVYIDPPFASGADYAKNVYLRRNPHEATRIAQAEEELEIDELRAFEEKMYGDIWNKEDYLNWMFENLTAIKSVMSETASIYVHLDWHIGHYVKVMLDEIFGEDNFVNEIVWQRTASHNDPGRYGNVHDVIFFYRLSDEYNWYGLREAHSAGYIEDFFIYAESPAGEVRKLKRGEEAPELWRRFRLGNFASPHPRPNLTYEYKGYKPPTNGWKVSLARMKELDEKGRLWFPASKDGRIQTKSYLDEISDGKPSPDIWTGIMALQAQSAERAEYATQKPEALLERILKASSEEGMVIGDFFGGSGVTAKVAHDLGRRFVHVDVGVNSLQTARDRLKAAGASFRVLDIQDGVSLFRNPAQTMDKLKTLIAGLKNEDGLDKFWEGAIQDPKLGLVPVYLPNLLDHQTKVLDIPLVSRILHEAVPDLPDEAQRVIVYYVDIFDRPEVERFIREHNMTGVEIELRDLKTILDEVVLNDEAETRIAPIPDGWEVEILRFASDRLQSKISEYNQKKTLTGKARTAPSQTDLNAEAEDMEGDGEGDAPRKTTPFKPIQISANGLELIEWLSVDCANTTGAWHSDAEIKIDPKGVVARNGKKTKAFWDAKITSANKPLRLKIRNIAGDESILPLAE